MIIIPNKNLKQKYYDNLSILWEALFLTLDDKRLVSFLSPEEFEERVSILRNSIIIEKLYEMLNIFGEDHFYEMVKPAIIELQDKNPSGEDYLDTFIECFNKI